MFLFFDITSSFRSFIPFLISFYQQLAATSNSAHSLTADSLFALLSTEYTDPNVSRDLLISIIALQQDASLRTQFIDASPHCVELFALWDRTQPKNIEKDQDKTTEEKIRAKVMILVAIVLESIPFSAAIIIKAVSIHSSQL